MIMSTIDQNLQAIAATIVAAAAEARRAPDAVRLLAVSKTFGPEAVLEAMRAGQRAFGENYLQEALDKIAAVAAAADPVHTVERQKIAQRLSEQRPAGMAPLNICLQVNISGEASKSGVAPADLAALAQAVAKLPNLKLRGLMAIPEAAEDFERQRAPFAQLRALYEQLRADGLALDTLSMGMSADLRAAVVEGATIVRVGSAIFGSRTYTK